MRKFLIPLLMTSAMIPATASAEPGDRGDRPHRERSENSDKSDNSSNDRPQRVQRVEQSDSDAPRVQPNVHRIEKLSGDAPRVRIERGDRPARVERDIDVETTQPVEVRRLEQQQETQPVQQVRRIEPRDGSNSNFLGAVQQAGRDDNARRRGEVVVRRDRDGDHQWKGDGDRNHHRWSSDWRRDHRYDWRSYRNRYSSLYRLGRYYDPYGWNYRRFSTGYNLWPSYYGSSNWLNDPWQYRLPPAYGPYRWVRYYDDALLVNIYTGQVADVIYNFFW